MAEIVALKTYVVRCNDEAIAILRAALEQAERGEIVAVALGAVEPSGSCLTQASGAENIQSLLGAVSILQHRMLMTQCKTGAT